GGVLESALEVGEQFVRTFTVPSGLGELNVSLAWSDVPAVGNVIPTLVNDLNLRLQDPQGTTHEPWLMRHHNPGAPVTRGDDSVNVCEKVTVSNPAAGVWTLRVTGDLNGSESQTFGLSANMALVQSWATISGQIRRADTGAGIAGRVMIMGSSQAANTDAQGNYVIFVPGNSQYPLQAISFGYVPRDTNVTVAGGNVAVNLSLATAQNGTISGVVQNQFGAPLIGSVVHFQFPMVTIPPVNVNGVGFYTNLLPGANYYGVVADYLGQQASTRVLIPQQGSVTANLTINDPRFGPAGPDGYGYFAYEITDPGPSAVYNWLEISPVLGGSGTPVTGASGNDWQTVVNLPFPIRFYGQQHTDISISADGWVHPGGLVTGTQLYTNVGIPTAGEPNGTICLFWDDLYPYHPQRGGDVSYYHDTALGRFIIEYNAVPHYTPPESTVTAQIMFYTLEARPTVTGDNEFQLQYRTLNYHGPGSDVDADATVGIENAAGNDGIQIVYDGAYHNACFELGPQYALRFTTGAITGYGTVQGQLTMIPPPPDVTQATIVFGQYSLHPQPNGSFSRDSVIAGTYTFTVTYPGYETGTAANVTVAPDSTVQQNFELYRLDPVRNLSGIYDASSTQIRLWWEPPRWESGGGLDELSGYRIMLGVTGQVATVTDTFYVYQVQQTREYDFWITAAYEGGLSDSSNHFRIYVDLSVDPMTDAVPDEFYLAQNYPNPFNPTTQIVYGLPEPSHVTLAVFDVLGRTVAVLQDGKQNAGVYRATLDGNRLGSGVYFYRLSAGEFVQMRKMLLVR
ncbi:carboxypeptidase-like regulatory domain-containing protein, partial [bacterium]|nr:carboxypeptidase-like regulatory domain-containing protein [bacterium]